MYKVVLLGTACLMLAGCETYEQSQLGPDRYRLAAWAPLTTYDKAADMLDAKAAEVCPTGHKVVSEETQSVAYGGSYSRVVRCVDYSDVRRPTPRPPGGP